MIRAMVVAVLAFGCTAATLPEPNVCERLAPQIGLKLTTLSRGKEQWQEWRGGMATLGHHLVGGSIATSIRIDPAEDAPNTPEEGRRLRDMCKVAKGGAECALVGPAVLEIGTRRGIGKVTANAGERAIIGMKGTTVYCRLN